MQMLYIFQSEDDDLDDLKKASQTNTHSADNKKKKGKKGGKKKGKKDVRDDNIANDYI